MHLLIVGPMNSYIAEASKIAHQKGAKVIHVDSINKGIETLMKGLICELVMCDVKMNVAAFIEGLKREHIHVPVVSCGVGDDTKSIVDTIKAGAKEYIPLPPDQELIAAILEAAAADHHQFIFHDAVMANMVALADKIAKSDASVLILGESGVGKEVMARYIHKQSNRHDKNFVSLNCAAIPEQLLESELFGHEKGAFTGALARRIGKFEQAHGGTLLLDEISEMEPKLQAKLLRVIQERELERVGGNQTVKVDVRILATSNRNLEEEIKKGTFREDLYFRLNVINLTLPPLRERPRDIVYLAKFFAEKYAKLNGIKFKEWHKDALYKLEHYPWPGNVRELENIVHRTLLLANSEILQAEDVRLNQAQMTAQPEIKTTESQTQQVGQTVAAVEKKLIIDTLHHCLGNRTHAAQILGISIRTLRNKLKQYSDEGTDIPLSGDDIVTNKAAHS